MRCALDELSDNSNVFRVNPLAPQLHARRGRPLISQDPVGFVRPVDLSAERTPSKAARLTESLGLGQKGLAPPQPLGIDREARSRRDGTGPDAARPDDGHKALAKQLCRTCLRGFIASH